MQTIEINAATEQAIIKNLQELENALHEIIIEKLCSASGRILPYEVLLRFGNCVCFYPDFTKPPDNK